MEEESTRKRKGSDATVCNQDYTPQLLNFDFENPPQKKKAEHQSVEEANADKTNVQENSNFLNISSTPGNESNSLLSFLRPPGSVDSNCTIPLECEHDSPSPDYRKDETDPINSEVDVRNEEDVTRCFEKNSFPVSEDINISLNNDSSEPPGNFTFVNLGMIPNSVSRGSNSSDEGVVLDKSPLSYVKEVESSDSTLETEEMNVFSPQPPVLSRSEDSVNEDESQIERVVMVPPGNFCSTVFTDHDYAILPKDSSTDSLLMLQTVAIREKEQYIPLDIGLDELDKKELELRKAASSIKENLIPITVQTKRLSDERELMKSKMTELFADISTRKEGIDSLNALLSNNQEQIGYFLEERNRHNVLIVDLTIKLVKTELKLRELQVTICQEKLKVVGGDTSDIDSIRLAIAEKEERIVAINADIGEFYKNEKRAKKALLLAEEQLKKYMEEDQALRLRINELMLNQRKAEALLSENQKCLEELTYKQKLLIKKKKNYSLSFVNLERMMVKIKVCRKLKELDCKEEALKDKAISRTNGVRTENVSATSNLQYSRQVTTVFGRNSVHEQPNASAGTSVQHYTSLQSIAIHNGSWLPRSLIPLPPHFPPGFLHVNSIVNPWYETQLHQNP